MTKEQTSEVQWDERVQGSRFRVQGSGFKVQGSAFRVQGSAFRVQGSRFRVQENIEIRIQGKEAP
jgi:hypothetical protein